MKKTIILKLGGSVITDKHSLEPKIKIETIKRIAKEIAEAYKKGSFSLVLIHGAGSYGHQIVKRTGIQNGLQTKEKLVAFAETQKQVTELNVIVCSELIKAGLPAVPFQPSSAIMESGRLAKLDIESITGLLEAGLIPVLYGVPAYDKNQMCSILSGDQLAPFLAKSLKAEKIIHGTNVDGVFTADPNMDKSAKRIEEINSENIEQVKSWLGGSSETDVTGGMFGKISELLNLGIESQIVSAIVPGRIIEAFEGKDVGTKIKL